MWSRNTNLKIANQMSIITDRSRSCLFWRDVLRNLSQSLYLSEYLTRLNKSYWYSIYGYPPLNYLSSKISRERRERNFFSKFPQWISNVSPRMSNVPSKNGKFLEGTINIGVPSSPNSGGDVSPATPPLDKPMTTRTHSQFWLFKSLFLNNQ